MCNFLSGIITKNGKVYFGENGFCDFNSHSEICEKNNIKDETTDPDKKTFARFEYVPVGESYDTDNYKLNVDEKVVPFWFKPTHQKKAIKEAKKKLLETVIIGQDIDKIKNRFIYLIKDSIIRVLTNSTVENMRDNSTVEHMYDTSTVKYMRNNSTVKYMRNNSTVKDMRDNSKAKKANVMYMPNKEIKISRKNKVK